MRKSLNSGSVDRKIRAIGSITLEEGGLVSHSAIRYKRHRGEEPIEVLVIFLPLLFLPDSPDRTR